MQRNLRLTSRDIPTHQKPSMASIGAQQATLPLPIKRLGSNDKNGTTRNGVDDTHWHNKCLMSSIINRHLSPGVKTSGPCRTQTLLQILDIFPFTTLFTRPPFQILASIILRLPHLSLRLLENHLSRHRHLQLLPSENLPKALWSLPILCVARGSQMIVVPCCASRASLPV